MLVEGLAFYLQKNPQHLGNAVKSSATQQGMPEVDTISGAVR